MPEEERSYVIVRKDGLVIRTKPITWEEAWWLYQYAYNIVEGRGARARYLEEWGNVMDVGENVTHLERHLEQLGYEPYYRVAGIYDPEELAKEVGRLRRLKKLRPEARQILEEFLDRARELLQRPVEPKSITAPVRYYEMPARHVRPDPLAKGGTRTFPKSDWHAFKYDFKTYPINMYGVSVYDGAFLMWRQEERGLGYTWMILVERGAADREVINAVLDDEAVQAFLRRSAGHLEEVVRDREEEMISRGYEDVARKAKAVLAAARLMAAGSREEEGVPA